MNAPNHDLEQRHHRQREAVSRLIQSKSFYEGDCDAVIREINESAARTLSVARVSIWQYNKERTAIRCLDLFELPHNRHSNCPDLSAESHPAYFRALTDTEIIAANDAVNDPRTADFANDYLIPNGITSMLDAPIHLGGVVDGVLCHEHIGRAREWTEDEKSFAVTLANLVSLAAEGAARARAQAEAAKNAARLNAVWETATDALRLLDEDGIICSVNAAFCNLFGMGRSELEGKPFTVTYGDDRDHKELQKRFRERFRRREVLPQEERRMTLRDGRNVDLEITSAFVESPGQTTTLLGLFRDITERKKGEQALRASERRFSEVFRASPAAMSISTVEDGRLIAVNERYCEFFGYTRDELIGKTISALGLWANSGDRPRMIERIRAEKTIREIETKFRHKSGALRDVLASFVLLDVPGEGEPILVSMLIDVTERKGLEEQLRQSQKLESIGQLAGGVAHDFNNILTVIQGHASLLLADPDELVARGDSAEQIAKSAERAADLTRQLLAFSRRQVMQPKDLDLNEIVRNMTRMLNRILGEDIRLQVEFSSIVPIVRADPGMMEQVLLNLAVNARDAMPKGGVLRIQNSIEEIDAASAHQNPEATPGPVVRLTVSDNGAGIPANVLPHIFEPFFTTKDVGKGTGLGLATVYGIVKQHRGWIKVKSELGQGATFEIFLPRSYAGQRTQDSRPASAQIPTGTETILIVEDELSVRLLTRRLLETLGYKVLEASDGESALELWSGAFHEIDLVLTDMVMPGGMSGMDLVEKLLPDKPQIKVIFCSGHSVEIFGKEVSLKPGASFLQKPYDNIKLAEAVRATLDA